MLEEKATPFKKKLFKSKETNNLFCNLPSLISLIIPDTLEEKKDKIYLGANRYTRNFIVTVYPNEIFFKRTYEASCNQKEEVEKFICESFVISG